MNRSEHVRSGSHLARDRGGGVGRNRRDYDDFEAPPPPPDSEEDNESSGSDLESASLDGSDVANALSHSSGERANSLSARDHCSDAVRQLLANATAAFEQGNFDAALHIYTQAQQQSLHEAEAASRPTTTAPTHAKSVQFSSLAAPDGDLKIAQVGQGMARHGCASCHRALNNLSEAQECYTESLRLLTKSLGSHHPELASVWNNLGSLQSQLNRSSAALECYEHALDVLKAQSSRLSSLHLSKVYSNMAALHQKQGRTEIAEGLYRKAASKCKDHVRLKKSDFRTLLVYGQTLINVAITAIAAHGHALAEDDLQHALKVWEKASSRFKSQHDSAICDGLSSVLALLGDAREKTGDLPSAERMMDQALKQAKRSRSAHAGKSLPSLYSNLARIQLASGDTVSASTTLKLAFDHVKFDIGNNRSEGGGSIHMEVPMLMCLRAAVMRREGRNEEALQMYSNAVDISKELYGPSVITATCINNMAFLAFHMKLLQQSRSLFMDAFVVLVDIHGHNDPHLVPILNNIGRVEEALGDFEAAQGFYARAIDISALGSVLVSRSPPAANDAKLSPLSQQSPSSSTRLHLFFLWLHQRAGSGFIVIRVRVVNLTKVRSQPRFVVEFGSSRKEPSNLTMVVGASRSNHKEEFFPSTAEQSLEFRDAHTASTPVVFTLFERRPLSGQKLVCSCSTPLQEFFGNDSCSGTSSTLSLQGHWFDMAKPSGNTACHVLIDITYHLPHQSNATVHSPLASASQLPHRDTKIAVHESSPGAYHSQRLSARASIQQPRSVAGNRVVSNVSTIKASPALANGFQLPHRDASGSSDADNPSPPPPPQEYADSSQLHGSAKVSGLYKRSSLLSDWKPTARDTSSKTADADGVFELQRLPSPVPPPPPFANRRNSVPAPPDSEEEHFLPLKLPQKSAMPVKMPPPPLPDSIQRQSPPPPPPAEASSSSTLRSKSPRKSVMPVKMPPPPLPDSIQRQSPPPPPPAEASSSGMLRSKSPRKSVMPVKMPPPPLPDSIQRQSPPPPPPAEASSSGMLRSKSPRKSVMPVKMPPPPLPDELHRLVAAGNLSQRVPPPLVQSETRLHSQKIAAQAAVAPSPLSRARSPARVSVIGQHVQAAMAPGKMYGAVAAQSSAREDWKFVLENEGSARPQTQTTLPLRQDAQYDAPDDVSLMSLGESDVQSLVSTAPPFKMNLPPAPGKRQSVAQRSQM